MHDFAGHGRNDLLAALGFDMAVAAAPPGARIDAFGGEFMRASLDLQLALCSRRHADFEGLAIKQKGKDVGSDLDGIDCHGAAIQGNPPAGGIAFEFNDAFFLSVGKRRELDLISHGRRSNCARRPSCFQREGCSMEEADRQECLSHWFACHIAAAMAAASAAELPD